MKNLFFRLMYALLAGLFIGIFFIVASVFGYWLISESYLSFLAAIKSPVPKWVTLFFGGAVAALYTFLDVFKRTK